jgi:DNA polymerase III alpha subunit
MRLDQYSNPIFNEQDLFEALYKGHSLSSEMFIESKSNNIKTLEDQIGFTFWRPLDDYDLTIGEYDTSMQNDWNMPTEYKTMDIEQFLVNNCPEENYQRLVDELEEFRNRNMIDLLRWLKYFVDTCTKENVVWGVGRGSSVASYVLYLIGVHSIDPIKYNLDWREFLR